MDMDLKTHIRAVADFPQAGILFRDITPLLADAKAFGAYVGELVDRYRDQDVQAVVGVESRGFIFGAPLALELGAAFIPVRKAGKLPAETFSRSYALEYGEATLEIHRDALREGQRVVIVDDLLATGGTAQAAAELVEQAGAEVVELAFLIELAALKGREKLADRAVHTTLVYEAGD